MPVIGPVFSSALDIWPGPPEIERDFRLVADFVDKLHLMYISLPKEVYCCRQTPPRSGGREWPRCEGRVFVDENTLVPWLIYLNPAGAQRVFTVAHEFGHLVQYAVDNVAGSRSSSDYCLSRLKSVLHESPTVKRLEDLQSDPDKLDKLALRMLLPDIFSGNRPTMHQEMSVHDYVGYLLSSDELFARSYSQWVATNSNNAEMIGQLNVQISYSQNSLMPEQWPLTEFEPIAEAIDELFRSLKWIQQP